MATGGDHIQPVILGIKDLNDVISKLEKNDFSEDRWNELGLKLHINQTKLNSVKADNPLDVKACLRGCLVLWLQQSYDIYKNGPPTLKLLATAVEKMELRTVAAGINQESTQSQEQSPEKITHIIEEYSSNYIKKLNGDFALFKAHLLGQLSKHVKNGVIELIEMARFVGEITKVKGLADVVSVDHLFDSIQDHYSYLNCEHIETIVNYFLNGDEDQDLKNRMEAYKRDLDNFEKTIKLKQLKKALDSVRSTHSPSSCIVFIKLKGEWENETLAKLKDFLRNYFKKDSLFNLSSVTDGCLSVTFLVPLSFSRYLIDIATPQLKSMSHVGVLQLVINNVVLLDEKDDINLNELLIEAVKLNEIFEVSLLLSLGADPYYKDSNRDSPVVLAKSKEVISLFEPYEWEILDANEASNKRQMKILVVGQNGSGKSSLINEMLGEQNLAIVGGPDLLQAPHNPIEEYKCKVGEVDVMIFDTRGFGDPSVTDKKTMNAALKIKTVDVVLICHRLYGRIDDATIKELKVLVDNMGSDFIDFSVLVFTFGDDYLSRCDPEFTNDSRLTEESKVEIKNELVTQQAKMELRLKEAFKSIGINKTIADEVPSCITCGKRKKNGEQKELPTSDNWVDDLWKLCEERCKPEARPFIHSTRRTIIGRLMMGAIGGGIGAVAVGSAIAVVGGVVAAGVIGLGFGIGAAGVGIAGIGVAAAIGIVKVMKGKK